jgi:tetratricopeptide (TPR) repeat protein
MESAWRPVKMDWLAKKTHLRKVDAASICGNLARLVRLGGKKPAELLVLQLVLRPFVPIATVRPARKASAPTHPRFLRPALLGADVQTLTGRTAAATLSTMLACACFAGCSNLNSQALNAEGVRLYQQGNYQQASVRFQEAIANDPDSANGYYNLAAALHKGGVLYNRGHDLRQAELLYNQCLEHDPNHTECYRGLAVLLTETNRQNEAFTLLQNWSTANPQLPDPRIELARLLEESGRGEEAKATLVDALTIDPNNARALAALGRIRDQAGDYAQAIANYQRSLELNRFQPQVAARVAALQGASGVQVPMTAAAPAAATPPASTNVGGWQPTVRY